MTTEGAELIGGTQEVQEMARHGWGEVSDGARGMAGSPS